MRKTDTLSVDDQRRINELLSRLEQKVNDLQRRVSRLEPGESASVPAQSRAERDRQPRG